MKGYNQKRIRCNFLFTLSVSPIQGSFTIQPNTKYTAMIQIYSVFKPPKQLVSKPKLQYNGTKTMDPLADTSGGASPPTPPRRTRVYSPHGV